MVMDMQQQPQRGSSEAGRMEVAEVVGVDPRVEVGGKRERADMAAVTAATTRPRAESFKMLRKAQ